MKCSRTERWLYTFAVVAFILFILVILFGQTVKESGPAEWLSALLNMVMAGAAVAAYLTARSWLPQLTTQEGYREAIGLVNDQFIQLGPFNTLGTAAENVVKSFLKNHDTRIGEGLKATATALNELGIHLSTADTVQQTIKKIGFRLNTYGLRAAEPYAEKIEAMISAFDQVVIEGWLLAELLTKDLTRNHEARKPPLSYNVANHAKILLDLNAAKTKQNIESAYTRFTDSLKHMVDSHDAIFSRNSSIGALYTVRK